MEQPRSLRLATALVAVQGTALAVFGLVLVVRALVGHPHDRGTAVLLGVTLDVYAAFVIAVAVLGLRRGRSWARTPTYLVEFFVVVIGLQQVHTVPALAAPLVAAAVITLGAVFRPDAQAALAGREPAD